MNDRLTQLQASLRDAVGRGRAASPQWIYAPLSLALEELQRIHPDDPELAEVLMRGEQALDLWRSWLGETSSKSG